MHAVLVHIIRVTLSLTLIFTFSNAAFAYDPYDCLNDISTVDSEINIGLATRLCSGSWSPEPVKCYQNISKVDQGISRFIAIDLCAGSVDAEKTIECYANGSARKLNRGLSTTLCGSKKPLDK